jgi:hypothetical protein
MDEGALYGEGSTSPEAPLRPLCKVELEGFQGKWRTIHPGGLLLPCASASLIIIPDL